MSRTQSTALPLLGKTHPLTGEPIRAIGWRPDGAPLWPIMGGDPSNDPPERPDDVSEEEWAALGDPGKQALVRVRGDRDQALEAKAAAERALAAARAKPSPPKPTPPAPTVDPKPGDQPDIAALVTAAVAEAFKPIQAAEQQRQVDEAAGKVRDAVVAAARDRLHDATDGLMINLANVVDAEGKPAADKIKAELDALLTAKPHLAKGPRTAPAGVGGALSPGSTDATLQTQVQASLARMQQGTGVKFATKS